MAKIAKAVVSLLVSEGPSALTSRRVAEEAGVSLATTTYYYASKFDLIADAQARFLDGYAQAFVQARDRHLAGETRIESLAYLMLKAMKSAVDRHGRDTLAWSEIMLDCSRDRRGHLLAREWFDRMEALWATILREIGAAAADTLVNPAIDAVMGTGFVTTALQLTAQQLDRLLADGDPLAEVCRDIVGRSTPIDDELRCATAKSRETRQRLISTAAEMLESGQAQTVSYSAVAQHAGLTNAAPAYHFASTDHLLACVNHELLRRMTGRITGMLTRYLIEPGPQSPADLLAVSYMRSVLEHTPANVAGIKAWLDAARNPELRGAVLRTILALETEFAEFLKAAGVRDDGRHAFILMAQFIGKFVRALASGGADSYFVRARSEFDRMLEAMRVEENPFLPSKLDPTRSQRQAVETPQPA